MSRDSDFDLGGYVTVAERIAELRERYPDATLQPVDLAHPWEIVTVAAQFFIVYAAACYRTPDDQRPGIGVAWEPVPGLTAFTRNSELQNAETSAWGRAIVAALAADTKRGIASAEEIRTHDSPPLDLASLTLDDVDRLRPRELFAVLGIQGGNVADARLQLRARLTAAAGGEVRGSAEPPAAPDPIAAGGDPPGHGEPPADAGRAAPVSAAAAGEGAPGVGSPSGEPPRSSEPDVPSALAVQKLKERVVALHAAGVSVDHARKARRLPVLTACDQAQCDDFAAMIDALEQQQAAEVALLREADDRRTGG